MSHGFVKHSEQVIGLLTKPCGVIQITLVYYRANYRENAMYRRTQVSSYRALYYKVRN